MRKNKTNHSIIRDPVCGIVIRKETARAVYRNNGKIFHFCSESCRDKMLKKRTKFKTNTILERK